MKKYTDTDMDEITSITRRVISLLKRYGNALTRIKSELNADIPTQGESFAQIADHFAHYLLNTTPEQEIRILKALTKHEAIADSVSAKIRRPRTHYRNNSNRSTSTESLRYTDHQRFVARALRVNSLEEAQAYN